MAAKKKTVVHAFNLRAVPEKLFFRIKQAAAVEHLSSRDWLLRLAEARLAELEREGKISRDKDT